MFHTSRARIRVVVTVGIASLAAAAAGPSALGSTPAAAAANWPQWRHDAAHTGSNPNETTIGIANVRSLTLAWSAPVTPGSPLRGAPAAVGQRLYVQGTAHQSLHAFSATGSSLWSASSTPPFNGDASTVLSPAVRGALVVGQVNSRDVALKATTGAQVWQAELLGTPVVSGTRVYGGGFSDRLGAQSLATGATVWGGAASHHTATPAVAAGRFFDSERTDTRVARNPATGAVLWSADLGGGSGYQTNADLLVTGGLVIGSCYRNISEFDICANDVRTGRLRWSRPLGSNVPLATVGGLLYVVTGNGALQALRVADGSTGWQVRAGAVTAPTVANGVVYVGTAGLLVAYNAARGGTPLWSGRPTGRIDGGGPVVANGAVYTVGSDGRLDAFRLR